MKVLIIGAGALVLFYFLASRSAKAEQEQEQVEPSEVAPSIPQDKEAPWRPPVPRAGGDFDWRVIS